MPSLYQTFNVVFYFALFFVLKQLAKIEKIKPFHKKLFKGFSIFFLIIAILLTVPTSMRWYVYFVDTYLDSQIKKAMTDSEDIDTQISKLIDLVKKDTNIASRRDSLAQKHAYKKLLMIDNEAIIRYCLETISIETDIHRKIAMVSLLGIRKDKSHDITISKLIIPMIKGNENIYLTVAVIITLGEIQTPESFNALMSVIENSKNEREVYIAILSVGNYMNKESIPLLKKKATSSIPAISEVAKYSITKITDPNFIPDEVKNPQTFFDRKINSDRKKALQLADQ